MNSDGFTSGNSSSDSVPVSSPSLPAKRYTEGIDTGQVSGIASPGEDRGRSDLLGEELGKLIGFSQVTAAEANHELAGFIKNDNGRILGFVG